MIAAGTIDYKLGSPPVTGTGCSWTTDDLDKALTGPVAEVFYDDNGSCQVGTFLIGLVETGFEIKNVQEILNRPPTMDDWRVGEALAECYLIHHRQCYFPWPDGRDVRREGSSLPGADLVGFQAVDSTDRFAFGEVKTSGEAKYPPGAVYGRTGLKQQLEDLRDDENIRDQLVLYLTYRAVCNPTWVDRFKRAAERYFKNKQDVVVFGILVRDVPPNEDDLRARVTKLGIGCPNLMSIELMAIYMPAKSIVSLVKKVKRPQKGGVS